MIEVQGETGPRNFRLEALIEANRHHQVDAPRDEVVKTAAVFADFLEGRTMTPGEKALNTMNEHQSIQKRAAEIFNRQYDLEKALQEVADATDSRGRKIVLLHRFAGADLVPCLRDAISKQVHSWGPDSRFIGSMGDPPQSDIEAERKFWHNTALLIRALELAL